MISDYDFPNDRIPRSFSFLWESAAELEKWELNKRDTKQGY